MKRGKNRDIELLGCSLEELQREALCREEAVWGHSFRLMGKDTKRNFWKILVLVRTASEADSETFNLRASHLIWLFQKVLKGEWGNETTKGKANTGVLRSSLALSTSGSGVKHTYLKDSGNWLFIFQFPFTIDITSSGVFFPPNTSDLYHSQAERKSSGRE